jgi:hypothetical protein
MDAVYLAGYLTGVKQRTIRSDHTNKGTARVSIHALALLAMKDIPYMYTGKNA